MPPNTDLDSPVLLLLAVILGIVIGVAAILLYLQTL